MAKTQKNPVAKTLNKAKEAADLFLRKPKLEPPWKTQIELDLSSKATNPKQSKIQVINLHILGAKFKVRHDHICLYI